MSKGVSVEYCWHVYGLKHIVECISNLWNNFSLCCCCNSVCKLFYV